MNSSFTEKLGITLLLHDLILAHKCTLFQFKNHYEHLSNELDYNTAKENELCKFVLLINSRTANS